MEALLAILSDPQLWIAFFTLTALELVLGIDNIIFISILVDKLPPAKREKARRIGLFFAMFMRVGLLLTLSWLVSNLKSRGPASVEICTLLRKPDAMQMEVDVKYIGFDIPNEFVVGYGLDYAEQYRNLRSIATLAPHVYS